MSVTVPAVAPAISAPIKIEQGDKVQPPAVESVTDTGAPGTSPSTGNTTENVNAELSVTQTPAAQIVSANPSVSPSTDTTASVVPNPVPTAATNPTSTSPPAATEAPTVSAVSAPVSNVVPTSVVTSGGVPTSAPTPSPEPIAASASAPVPTIPSASVLAAAPAVSTVPALPVVPTFSSAAAMTGVPDEHMVAAVSTVPSLPVVSTTPVSTMGAPIATESSMMGVVPSTAGSTLGVSAVPTVNATTSGLAGTLPTAVAQAVMNPLATQTAMMATQGSGSVPISQAAFSSVGLSASTPIHVGTSGAIKGVGGGGRASSGAAGAARAAAVAAAAAASAAAASRMEGVANADGIGSGITMGEEPLLEVAEASRLANDAFNRVKAEKIAEQSMHINRAEEAAQYEGLGSEIVGKAMKQRERERSNRAAAAASRARVITYQQELEARLNRMEAERNAYRREVSILQAKAEEKVGADVKNEATTETENEMATTNDGAGDDDAIKEQADGDVDMTANGEELNENETQSRNQLAQVQLWVKRMHSQDPQLFSQLGTGPSEMELLLKNDLVHDRPISTETEPSSKRRRL